MNKYLIIKLVFDSEVLGEINDLMLDEVEGLCARIEKLAMSMGAEVFMEEVVNNRLSSRAYATVEHNFALTDAQKKELTNCLVGFFVDGQLLNKTIETHNTLAAVRFLQASGELYKLN